MPHPALRRRVPLLFALTVTLAGCQEGTPPDAASVERLEGVVLDALDGAPVVNALVRLAGSEATSTTDAQGRFSIPAGAGSCALHVEAPDHLAGSRVRIGAGDHAQVILQLWPRAPSEADVHAHLARLEIDRVLRDDPADPALRPEARAFLRGEAPPVTTLAPTDDVGATRAALDAPPATIRVWRRSIDGAAASCEGRIDVIPFEEYVAGVLPHEWIPSWHEESLRAGALAIRTYSWGWIERGGKYDCADLDDTARSQVYDDDRVDRASAAVDATRSMAITSGGALVSGEYSAENGDPTDAGVAEPLCVGFEIRGHRRGMCQWGSQRWAQDGRDHLWIAAHYYLDSIVENGGDALPDYDAAFVAQDVPAAMVEGERAEVTVELTNTGRRAWDGSSVRLATREESAFFDEENWIDATRATPPDVPPYSTGELGRFTFWITAPQVDEARVVTETFELAHLDATDAPSFFGPPIPLSLQVTPRDGGAVMDGASSDRDAAPGDASGPSMGTGLSGCGVGPFRAAGFAGLGAPLLFALALVRARRGR